MIVLALALALGMFGGLAEITINANASCGPHDSYCPPGGGCLPSAREAGNC
ncbi:MAG: hypothetical protein ACRD6U_04855 [Nitrososphaeraceae archaeon]